MPPSLRCGALIAVQGGLMSCEIGNNCAVVSPQMACSEISTPSGRSWITMRLLTTPWARLTSIEVAQK